MPSTKPVLPIDTATRKASPVATGFVDYFPLAMLAVAACSLKAGQQHTPGEPMRWAKDKSTDHADCLMRHFIDRGTVDTDGIRHSTKVAWRAMALLQTELENEAKQDPQTQVEAFLLSTHRTGSHLSHSPESSGRKVP